LKLKQIFIHPLVALLIMLPMLGATGCTQAQVKTAVQNTVNTLTQIEAQVPAAKSLGQTLALAGDPALGNAIIEYATEFDTAVTQVIKIGNAYLQAPSATGFQGFLNGVDALAASIDTQVLAAAHISNPQSKTDVLVKISAIATLLHIAAGIIQGVATSAQKAATPKLANAVPIKEVRPYLDADLARQTLNGMGYNADAVMAAAGF
jgi:hypothetical protein